jgi:hypothetical protein
MAPPPIMAVPILFPLYRFFIVFSISFRFLAGYRRGDRDKNTIDKTHRPRYPQV